MTQNRSGQDPYRIARLILELRQAGVMNTELLKIVENIPREKFVREDLQTYAYDNVALPIACGQSLTLPTSVVQMVNALELGKAKEFTVLEIGTGSGYMSALLSKLARRVYTLDRYRTLTNEARKRLEEIGVSNVVTHCADGAEGWPSSAPFDRIIATCALEDLPQVWLDQLKPDGILVMPIGTNEEQRLVRVRKTGGKVHKAQPFAPSNFLHLIEGVAKQL